jgi:serine/threonine protein phosphatase PrpC
VVFWSLVVQEVADIVCRCADKMGLQSCAELLTATSIRKGSMDNTTALVVDLRGHRVRPRASPG